MHTLFWSENLMGNTPLRGSRSGCEESIRMDVTEISWEVVDWILLTQNRDQCRVLVNMVMNIFFNWLLQSLSDLGLP
jgi:hypothetical protein